MRGKDRGLMTPAVAAAADLPPRVRHPLQLRRLALQEAMGVAGYMYYGDLVTMINDHDQ